ncbi:MAG: hypothetical protein M3077_14760, partial [Candidatus Dormibacteraeota bacterium]|nr:hypothetical protein [Candidatus Dormibacteraeota bacterium]
MNARPAPPPPSRWRGGSWVTPVVALAIYVALAFLLFINTWVHPFTYAVGSPGDAPQFMWFLEWSAYALTHAHNPLFTTYLDYPAGVNMLWNCTVPLLAAVLTPVTLALGPVFSFNLLATLAVGLSAFTAFLFIRRYVA